MMIGLNEYFDCPTCGKTVSRIGLISGNTVGERLYSDGQLILPMFPEEPAITRCLRCSTLFWITEEIKSDNQEQRRADDIKFLTIYEYLTALKNGTCKLAGQVLFIRKRIWWAFNDRIRKRKTRWFSRKEIDKNTRLFRSAKEKEIWTENVHQLLAMFASDNLEQRLWMANINSMVQTFASDNANRETGAEDPPGWFPFWNSNSLDPRIWMVEIYRNLGEFQKCREILATLSGKNLNWIKALFEKEIEKKNRFVFQLDEQQLHPPGIVI
ncbi:MAG: hypothetical protein GXO90_00925 [FCB group bacterium]|nr:hypothetical protein [FCB group bacterium]